jgi:DNA polymerase-3 subunit gamma/tau
VTRTVAPVLAPVAQIVAPVTRTVTRTIAPVVAPVANAVAPVTRPVMKSVAPVTRPVTKPADPTTETVTSTAREVSRTVGLDSQTDNLVAPAVAPAGRPASKVITLGSVPADKTHASAPISFGSVTTVLGDSAALPQLTRSAMATASSLAATFTAGLVRSAAPRTACLSCGSAHPASPAPLQAPELPSAPFTGSGTSAGSGAGGFSLFLVGVLFLTLGAAPRRWTRRRMASALGWPAPYIALSVSPD